jgi:predicted RND superfamily exporter protein
VRYGIETDEYYMLGGSSSAVEIKEIVNADYKVIMWISIGLVALILFFAFRNFIIPILLVFMIQGSVYISMSVNALTGGVLVFLGYLIVSSVMLGTTIDYAILYTNNYLESRRTRNKYDAAADALSKSSRAILTSSLILCFTGIVLQFASTMPAISVFGELIGRTALASLIMVFVFLPCVLMVFDKLIRKTTIGGVDFYETPVPVKEQRPEAGAEVNKADGAEKTDECRDEAAASGEDK